MAQKDHAKPNKHWPFIPSPLHSIQNSFPIMNILLQVPIRPRLGGFEFSVENVANCFMTTNLKNARASLAHLQEIRGGGPKIENQML